jgi:hypothetical protein
MPGFADWAQTGPANNNADKTAAIKAIVRFTWFLPADVFGISLRWRDHIVLRRSLHLTIDCNEGDQAKKKTGIGGIFGESTCFTLVPPT